MPEAHKLDHYDLFYRYMAHGACGRLLPLNTCHEDWNDVHCKKCLRHRPRDDQTDPPPPKPQDQK